MPFSNYLYENHAIIVSGARVHNLKNISLTIPRDKLIVCDGVIRIRKIISAFDTIMPRAEAYVESLSSYARQFSKNE